MTEPSVERLFTTPVLAGIWPEAPAHNAALRNAIVARRGQVQGVSKSNLLGWQSDLDLIRWGGAAAERLRGYLVEQCTAITDGLGTGDMWVAEMWANVSPPGASNQTHAHPGSLWSAVYYVDDGLAGGSAGVDGELTFLDPRFPMVRMASPHLRYRKPDGALDHQEVWMKPRSGLVVMFPSWLQHAVRPYRGNGVRISIAVNLWVRHG